MQTYHMSILYGKTLYPNHHEANCVTLSDVMVLFSELRSSSRCSITFELLVLRVYVLIYQPNSTTSSKSGGVSAKFITLVSSR